MTTTVTRSGAEAEIFEAAQDSTLRMLQSTGDLQEPNLALAVDEFVKALAPVDADAAIRTAIQSPSGIVKNK